ncbi:MAG: cupredoxin domain-containing protein [Dehalococcoidia bacterium]
MHRRFRFIAAVAMLVLASAFGAACGGDDDDDGGPIAELTEQAGDGGVEATSEATESAAEDTPAGAIETPADGAVTPGAGGGAGAAEVEIAAENADDFTESELTAPAGSVTIVFENRDDGVTHNFALYDSEDAPEDPIDATELVAGPATSEIMVDLEPGVSYYNCQVHPPMEGTLTVE